MRITGVRLLALTVLLVTPGCQIYFGNHGDDDCVNGGAENGIAPLVTLLNPESFQCEDPYPHNGGNCKDVGGTPRPRSNSDTSRPGSEIDWAQCVSACTGLSENDCLRSDGCRALYNEGGSNCPNGSCDFYDSCVGTAPSGPVRYGSCDGLNAYDCSLHDDCSVVRQGVGGPFGRCVTEKPSCGPATPVPPPPPPQPRRNPESGKCESQGGGGDPCSGVDMPPPQDWAVCDGQCSGLNEATCKASDACRAIYANERPPNVDDFHLIYKDCWPTAPSGPVHGGQCQGLDAYRCSLHDDCVAQHDSDWSGCMDPAHCDWTIGHFLSCAAESQPPPPPPACSTLAEPACISRSDCEPLYLGSNCSCSPAGCTCQTWTFDLCQPRS